MSNDRKKVTILTLRKNKRENKKSVFVTGIVVLCPKVVIPKESPTKMPSTPDL